jgi:hypothetical protein
MNIKETIETHLYNLPGWRTSRKLVVIESDDWGSIRIPSRKVLDLFEKNGIPLKNLAYNSYDSLASESDITALFDVLYSVKDKNGRSAVITANTIVANPDFKKIRENGFNTYYYETFDVTMQRYSQHKNSFNLLKQGISSRIFRPQFHGREHLNVHRWLKALLSQKRDILTAFEYEMYDLSTGYSISENKFVDALNYESKSELPFLIRSISEGLDIFYSLFGYKSLSFIAPCYIWPNEIESVLVKKNIKLIQGAHYHLEPLEGLKNKFRKHFHYTGQKSKSIF